MILSIKINSDLIEAFRKKVNEETFFCENFKNVKGKNFWNIICSSMDWLTVAADGLPEINVEPKGFGCNHVDTLNLMQYIITIDILAESIIQLYRVIGGERSYPLTKDNSIFNHIELSDDKFFKHIRAVFSTHPVNLDSLDGVKRLSGERFYASWVAKNGIDDDYYVLLYSNNPEKDNLNSFGINLKDINAYAEKRYNLLEDLICKVKKFNTEHIQNSKKSVISTINNPVEQLIILHKENEIRFGKDLGYAGSINYLLRLIQTDMDSYEFGEYFTELFNEYREHMILGISKIKEGLQNMSKGNFYIKYRGSGYEFEKIYQYLSDGEHPIGKEYFEGLIKKSNLPAKLIKNKDMESNRFILDAYLFSLAEKLGKDKIKLNEIVEIIYPYGEF